MIRAECSPRGDPSESAAREGINAVILLAILCVQDNTLPLMWPFIEVTLAADMSVLNSSAYAYCKYTWIHRPDALLLAAQLVCTDVCMRPM